MQRLLQVLKASLAKGLLLGSVLGIIVTYPSWSVALGYAAPDCPDVSVTPMRQAPASSIGHILERSKLTAAPPPGSPLRLAQAPVQPRPARPAPLRQLPRLVPGLGNTNRSVGLGADGRPGRVPFYVYAGAAFEWELRCGPDGEPTYTLSDHGAYKHGNDHQFAEQAKLHPWRVHNPADAVLFVIPFLLGYLSRVQRCAGLEASGANAKWKSVVIDAMIDEVLRQPHYGRYGGRDHLMLSTDFRLNSYRQPFKARLPGLIWGQQLHNWWSRMGGSCSFAVPMSSMLMSRDGAWWAARRAEPWDEWSRRPHALYFQGQIDTRKAYGARQQCGEALKVVSSGPDKELLAGAMFVATPYEHAEASYKVPGLEACRCPQQHGAVTPTGLGTNCLFCVQVGGGGGEFHGAADVRAVLASNPYETDLAASRLAAHIRGDLPGSNRVYDIVKAGAVPVMVSNDVDVTLPFPDVVPWKQLRYSVDEHKKSPEAWTTVLRADRADIERKRAIIAKHAEDVLWEADGSRVTTNVLLGAARFCLGLNIPLPAGSPDLKYRPKWKHINKQLKGPLFAGVPGVLRE